MAAASMTTPCVLHDTEIPRLLAERMQNAAQPPSCGKRDSASYDSDLLTSNSRKPGTPDSAIASLGCSSPVDESAPPLNDADAIPAGLPCLPVPCGFQLNFLDPYLAPLVRDPRDTVFVKASMHLMVGVLSALYLVLGSWSWWHFAAHVAWVGSYATTFVLMLHCVCHRPLYKREYNALNHVVPYLLAPFYGHTWDTFYFHHIKHHHIEDNGPNDLSSTLRYQRDNALHFMHYFLRFLLFAPIELPLYFVRKGWPRTAARVFVSELGSWTFYYALMRLGEVTSSTPEQVRMATTLCLVVPVVAMRFGMISGNWAQHSFVDPERMDCDYVQSLTCIDSPYNRFAFNDGYHTSHHLNPRRHWADHPGNLIACADDYAKHGTLVFQGIDFHVTWWYLMTKNYAALAKAYVHLDTTKPRPSDAAIEAMLRERTRRVPDKVIDAYYNNSKTKAAARAVFDRDAKKAA